MIIKTIRGPLVVAVAALAVGALAGCSSSGSGGTASSDSAGGTYTWWDPYPQHEDGSDWANRVQACGTEAGVTIQRTAYDTTALTNQALLAAQEGTAPDIILLDNPAVSTLAETGMLTTTDDLGLDTSDIDANLLAAGELDGKDYGIPIGANTLALYYNADILSAAGVDPASITSWASLTDALAKVTAAGHKGITFAGINTEEGSFQFLPWFWGAGADLTKLDSPEAVKALDLWTDWVKKGYAPQSVISNSQNTSWEEFLTGDFAFGENGTWQVNSAADQPFKTGVIELPAETSGVAPAPTGGEFITAPVQKDTSRYETTKKIIDCMTTPEGFVETANTFAYYIPPTKDGQDKLLAEHPELETWVSAVQAAKGRTSDNLGTDYPLISEQLWTAVQSALSGASSPQDALTAAQQAASSATNGK
ncbi:ABC transporter substrate-binding protein [Cnuibacter physcomitrellae]|uniref:ABC transporter substrate-binding protein n=1 Tax=Cnuibacter physcomitrellae TaxID=1619308 RepID=A0A1X9LHZ7_9MICO|nr:extracellular solute-binding protein [Cnuibacter physcomitrellae]ARJ04747.1 ABC transporter substrate-binding protein [Cnuibacter physcomitrellae]GGI41987.1 ABC transporter substrate-binding protein [Cnuibacter physcomitrellae]